VPRRPTASRRQMPGRRFEFHRLVAPAQLARIALMTTSGAADGNTARWWIGSPRGADVVATPPSPTARRAGRSKACTVDLDGWDAVDQGCA
jgi:hypothetical protein